MALNLEELIPQMLDAAKGELKGQFKATKSYAEAEFKKLLANTEHLAASVASGEMTIDRAKRHFKMQQRAAATVLLTVEGMAADSAERAINAALDVVKGAVNAALPVNIL